MKFLDANILVYAFDVDEKAAIAQSCLPGALVSVQGLNEFAAVMRRKKIMSWRDIAQAIDTILAVCAEPLPVDLLAHRAGLRIADRYRLSTYDSIMLATALNGGATTFLSEDLHHGLVIDGRVTIENPFLSR